MKVLCINGVPEKGLHTGSTYTVVGETELCDCGWRPKGGFPVAEDRRLYEIEEIPAPPALLRGGHCTCGRWYQFKFHPFRAMRFMPIDPAPADAEKLDTEVTA